MFDFSAFPTLTTERMLLRELRQEDAADVFVFRSDPYVQRFNAEPMKAVAEAEEFIEWMLAQYRNQKHLLWGVALQNEDKVIGLVGFGDWSRHHNRAMLGYDLAQAYWGQGFASEAVKRSIRFGYEEMGLHRIEAETIADNSESVRMLQRLGFQLEGLRRGYSLEDDGVYHDSAMYALLRQEYELLHWH